MPSTKPGGTKLEFTIPLKHVSLITGGSCIGNPGPGGWARILRFGAHFKELFGFDPNTTNNRMDHMAPIQGLLSLNEPCESQSPPAPNMLARASPSGPRAGGAAIGGKRIGPFATPGSG